MVVNIFNFIRQNNNSQPEYRKMRRIDHLAMKDILRKRHTRTTYHPESSPESQQPSLLVSHKDISMQHIMDKIYKSPSSAKSVHIVDLSLEEKYAIVEFMSERENISYNRGTLAMLMNVWRCPHVCYIDNSTAETNMDIVIGKRPLKNFFLLAGQVAIYDRPAQLDAVMSKQQEDPSQFAFETESKPKDLATHLEEAQPKTLITQQCGWGPIFRRDCDDTSVVLRFTNAIIIEVKSPQLEGMLINLGGMDQEKKLKVIEQFPIFSNINKKIQSILPYIALKKYSKNQYIYKLKEIPQAVYLILKGEVIFQVKVQLPRNKKTLANKSMPSEIMFQTEALGIGNYFGEEEIILKTARHVNTVCNSAECDLLEIPVEKFEKLLTYADFYEEVKAAAEIKINKRKEKIDKSMQIHKKFSKSPDKSIQETERQEPKPQTLGGRRDPSRKRSSQPVKLMHGNVIRKVPAACNTQQVNFSMLGANPDMYEATLKKFRKYTMKPAEKYKPEVNWNLKRVWKVLNLQSILRQDAEVTSPEGRKFYESHRRLQNHVQQVKSLRPKTSSSTYRTKLQYIAYLQQFNN